MGVYIKDMNMPDECYCCPCSQPVAGGLQGRCNLLWRDFSGNPHSKDQDCPLVEVAEPHGRLIDADNLEKSLIDDNRQAFTKHQVWLMFSEYNKNVPTVLEAESEE